MDPYQGLADALRSLIEAVQLADIRPDTADELAGRIAQIADELPVDGRTSWHAPGTVADEEFVPDQNVSSLNDLRDPVVGTYNPVAPPLVIEVVETDAGVRLRGEVTLSAAYEGAARTVHGGIVCAVMDEMLGMAQRVLPVAGYTGTLTIRFRAPTPTYMPLVAEAWMDRTEGRKIFMAGTLHAGEQLCAEAEGIFISPRKDGV